MLLIITVLIYCTPAWHHMTRRHMAWHHTTRCHMTHHITRGHMTWCHVTRRLHRLVEYLDKNSDIWNIGVFSQDFLSRSPLDTSRAQWWLFPGSAALSQPLKPLQAAPAWREQLWSRKRGREQQTLGIKRELEKLLPGAHGKVPGAPHEFPAPKLAPGWGCPIPGSAPGAPGAPGGVPGAPGASGSVPGTPESVPRGVTGCFSPLPTQTTQKSHNPCASRAWMDPSGFLARSGAVGRLRLCSPAESFL